MEEQIIGTQDEPQMLVTQGYSRSYSAWIQQSRLQWIYQLRELPYNDLVTIFVDKNQTLKSGHAYFFSRSHATKYNIA